MRVEECEPSSRPLHMTLIATERERPGLSVNAIVIPPPIVSGPSDNRRLNGSLLS